jgi:hypothetical protein
MARREQVRSQPERIRVAVVGGLSRTGEQWSRAGQAIGVEVEQHDGRTHGRGSHDIVAAVRRARKEPHAGDLARSRTRPWGSVTIVRGEPGAWLPAEQNELLAARCTADRAPLPDAGCVVDGRAGCRWIEIFAAMLPIEWG